MEPDTKSIMSDLLNDPNEIDAVDLTFRELTRLEDVMSMKFILEFMKDIWCGNTRSRETRVRMGTMYIRRDDNGTLELKFITRFKIDDDTFDAVKDIQKEYCGTLTENWNQERLEALRKKYGSE